MYFDECLRTRAVDDDELVAADDDNDAAAVVYCWIVRIINDCANNKQNKLEGCLFAPLAVVVVDDDDDNDVDNDCDSDVVAAAAAVGDDDDAGGDVLTTLDVDDDSIDVAVPADSVVDIDEALDDTLRRCPPLLLFSGFSAVTFTK
jgi:hypothetical protein